MRKFSVFQIFLLRIIKAYLCPNIIDFDSVDFSERRPEEVISFFWRLVYLLVEGLNQIQASVELIDSIYIYSRWLLQRRSLYIAL